VADPTVAVVIPSVGRQALQRAVSSVESQTRPADEIIIVVDESSRVADIADEYAGRATVLDTGGGRRGAAARNLGLDHCVHDFVAFLDDDDWWEPTKLETQLASVMASGHQFSWTYTQFHGESSTRVLPRNPPRGDQAPGDYLIQRSRLTHGDGYIQTSSLLVATDLAKEVRWDDSLKKHQDWDFILKVVDRAGLGAMCSEPLVHVTQGSPGSVSRSIHVDSSEKFLQRHREALSSVGAADFVLVHLVRPLLRSGDWRAAWSVWRTHRLFRPHAAAVLVGLAGLAEWAIQRTRRTTR